MPETTRTSKRLTDGQQLGLGLAVTGMLAVGAYGLVISYWTVRELAEKLRMPLPHIFPVGIEGGMIAVLAIDIVLTWIGRPIGWLRQVARALSATAIGINAYAGAEYGLAAVIMHALAPAILIVGVEALRHHLLVVLQVPEEKEPIPRGRWLLAPLTTVAMWRRMILWQQPRYSDALDVHLDRHEAIAELRRAFGWRWQKRIPAGLAYRLSVGVRLEQSTAEVRAILAEHYAQDAQEHHAEHASARPASTPAPWHEPVRIPAGPSSWVIAGGDRIDGHLTPGERPLLPVECSARARARQRALAEGSRAVAEITAWRESSTHDRRRSGALAAAAGGGQRALPEGSCTTPDQRFARARTAPSAEHTEPENPGAAARRAAGVNTRERIAEHLAEHPEHTPEQIAEAVGVHVTTVRRHLRRMAPAPA